MPPPPDYDPLLSLAQTQTHDFPPGPESGLPIGLIIVVGLFVAILVAAIGCGMLRLCKKSEGHIEGAPTYSVAISNRLFKGSTNSIRRTKREGGEKMEESNLGGTSSSAGHAYVSSLSLSEEREDKEREMEQGYNMNQERGERARRKKLCQPAAKCPEFSSRESLADTHVCLGGPHNGGL